MPLTFVTWLWKPPRLYRSQFGPSHVNVLRRMVARHYQHPHRFLCVTDITDGLDEGVEVVPPWNDFADLPSPHGGDGKNPSCYRRLRMFHPEIGAVFGERFVSLDLDCLILGDLTQLFHRDEAFMAWGDTNPNTAYNGSMLMLTAGARPQVWTEFDPVQSPRLARQSGCFGSDQGWISFVLGRHEAKWTKADGVYSYRNDIAPSGHQMPPNARIIFFHGRRDPWHPYVQAHAPWVREAYQ